jgi:hypothetical protein
MEKAAKYKCPHEKRSPWKAIEVVGFAISVLAIFLAFYFASPVNLSVRHEISYEDGGHLLIYGKNNDFFRSTGTIHLYRLEVSDSKPHMQLKGNYTLGPGQERLLFDVQINVSEKTFSIPADGIGQDYQLSLHEMYFVTEKTSISYRITCDACSGQGIVERIPHQAGPVPLVMENGALTWKTPVYTWDEFEPTYVEG